MPPFAMESSGRLGVEGSVFIDQLGVSVVGGRDGGSMVRNDYYYVRKDIK